MSWEDFLAEFKARHPDAFPDERHGTVQTVSRSPIHSPTTVVNAQRIKTQPTNEVVEEVSEWDGAEFVDSDEPEEFTEVVE